MNGNALWDAGLGASEDIWIEAIAQRGSGQTFVCGQIFSSATMIGGEPILNYNTDLNIFVTRIRYKDGKIIYNRTVKNENDTFYAVPNPVGSSFKILNKNFQTSDNSLKMELLDVSGNFVKQQELFQLNETSIDISDQRTGLYFGKIYQDGKLVGTLSIIKR